jgi:peptidoglycan hydrolase-like protein with peptidoglycan-binding domain
MKKLAIALLASSALAVPAFAAPMNNSPPKQAQQQSQMQQPQTGMQQNGQNGQQAQNGWQQNRSTAFYSPRKLSHNQVRKIQIALNKDGFDAGHVDGTWGPKTRSAVRHFQKAKDISARGHLTKKTLSDLGVQVASNQYNGNNKSQQPNMGQKPGMSTQGQQPNGAAGNGAQGSSGK